MMETDLVKRLKIVEEGLGNMRQFASADIVGQAATRIKELERQLEEAREALRGHACGCEGDCERLAPNAYAGRDASCRAHDTIRALKTKDPT